MTKKIFIAGSVQYANLYNYGTTAQKLEKYNEGTQAQIIVDYLVAELKLYDVEVLRTVKGMDLNASAKMANDNGCNSYYAIHTNAGGGEGTVALKQTSVYVPYANRVKSAAMATELTNAIAGLGRRNRGTYGKRDSLGREWFSDLRKPKMPSTILEIEFHDWSLGAEWIINNKALIGRTIARSIAQVEGLVKKIVTYKGAFPTAPIGNKNGIQYGTFTNKKRWQEFLCWYGLIVEKDGSYGKDTKAKTVTFQKQNGLEPDGNAGMLTINKSKTVGKL